MKSRPRPRREFRLGPEDPYLEMWRSLTRATPAPRLAVEKADQEPRGRSRCEISSEALSASGSTTFSSAAKPASSMERPRSPRMWTSGFAHRPETLGGLSPLLLRCDRAFTSSLLLSSRGFSVQGMDSPSSFPGNLFPSISTSWESRRGSGLSKTAVIEPSISRPAPDEGRPLGRDPWSAQGVRLGR